MQQIGKDTEKQLSQQSTRVALIGIVVENPAAVPQMNDILHSYASYIIGRMGIPYEKRGVSVISVAVDAPQQVISALSGKIGRLEGISTKTITSAI
ncbi:MAG: iron-only hydrogenase system regulator [Eubacterium sp.]|nr:iron-only hydrogenase system regulator [Eubacterium sp.]